MQEGEIYVATGSSLNYALWGGLMSARAIHLKAAGVVLDGYVRDTAEIRKLGFPVFSQGSYAQDQGARGKVLDYRVPIRIGAASIQPGDLLLEMTRAFWSFPNRSRRRQPSGRWKRLRRKAKWRLRSVMASARTKLSTRSESCNLGIGAVRR